MYPPTHGQQLAVFTFAIAVLWGIVSLLRADQVALQNPTPAFRGFWADVFHPGFKSTAEIDDMVARAVEGNYNAILMEVLAYQDDSTAEMGHGAYYNSDIVPKARDIVGEFDPLGYLISQAHPLGLEVHAWIVPYRVCKVWPPSGNTILAAHPEWTMTNQGYIGAGPTPINGLYLLDPGCPEVQEHIIAIVRELVTDYEIDGIHWDYIRYVTRNAGYPADSTYVNSGLARFQRLTGYAGIPPYEDESWCDFRRREVSELVRRGRGEVAAITSNPRQPVRYTAALIQTDKLPASFNSSTPYWIFQDWNLWMRQGWLDAGCPMCYSSNLLDYQNSVDAAVSYRYDRYIYVGQGGYLNNAQNNLTQLEYARDHGADGTVSYSYYSSVSSGDRWAWYGQVAASLFTQPVETPAMPWRDPETSTEGTVWGRITDYTTGQPIDDAEVSIGPMESVRTDGNGYYLVSLLPAGPEPTIYETSVSGSGYANPVYGSVQVQAAGLTRKNILLGIEPQEGPLIEASPALIELSFEAGFPSPPAQQVSISLAGAGAVDWSIDETCGWLTVTPETGTVSDELTYVTLNIDTTGLPEAMHQCTV